MRINKIEVENFRLLENIGIDLDEETTLIVGRNNSGKTSLTEVFHKFLSSGASQFVFEDFSIASHTKIIDALKLFEEYEEAKGKEKDETELIEKEIAYKNMMPEIIIKLYVEYEETDSLSSLSKFIMDLDPDRKDALISCEYRVENAEKIFKEFNQDPKKYSNNIIDFLKKNYKGFYRDKIYAVDEQNRNIKREVSKKEVEDVFLTRFIYAQNQLDDQSIDRTNRLSKGFEDYYKFNSTDNSVIEKIEDALLKVSEELDGNYKSLFDGIFTDLKNFGLDSGANIQNLEIKSQFEPATILKGNTQLYYEHEDSLLPEAHNGLGYSKLIFITLQFISFFEEYSKREPRSELQLLFVEEPEVHLHPQMQQVFIRNVRKFIEDKKDWKVQLVITTHSSHIVAESGFECIRYFDISEPSLKVKNLSEFQKLQDEQDTKAGKKLRTIDFLKQYMSLNRCDMFFADKIILIEGSVERLLLPEIIQKDVNDLRTQYLSIIEVGGAHAHNFSNLLKFINVKTLIITDIDSVKEVEKEGRKSWNKCPVADGEKTSNQILKQWMPKKEKIEDLLKVNDEEKTDDKIRVVYQVPESELKQCGRSFEESFILKNAQIMLDNKDSISSLAGVFESYPDSVTIQSNSYDIASKVSKKTDFAFDVMMTADWETPKYIEEGLVWLSQ